MEASQEIRQQTLRLYEAMSNADLATIEELVSRQAGSLAIGTDPKEWWTDANRFIEILRIQLAELGEGARIAPSNPQAYSEGTIGWSADQPRFIFPNGDEMPFRHTLVFRKEGDEWKIIQFHASIGLSNEETLGKELTTE